MEGRPAEPADVGRVMSLGCSLEVVTWGGTGRRAVAMHGFLDHGWAWDVFVPSLGGVIDLVTFSARGHGRSDRADAYQWADFVADFRAVVRAVAKGPVDVIGHSWGGHLALQLALFEPGLVRRVVNVDGIVADQPAGWFPNIVDRTRRVADRGDPGLRPGFESLEELTARRQALTPRVPPGAVASFARHGAVEVDGRWHWALDPLLATTTLPWDRQRANRPLNLATAIADCPSEVLLVTGGVVEDRHLTPDRTLAFRASAEQDHVHHLHVPSAGHYVHVERPDLVGSAVAEFLA